MEPLAFLVLLAIFIGAVIWGLAGPVLIGGGLLWGWFKLIEHLERDSDDPIIRPAD